MGSPKEIDWSGSMPVCQSDEMGGETCTGEAVYDVPTVLGPWGNLCEKHLGRFGGNVGIGFKRVVGLGNPNEGKTLYDCDSIEEMEDLIGDGDIADFL